MDLLDFPDRTGGVLDPAQPAATVVRRRIGAGRPRPGAPGRAR
ncbi:hypothetical protein [Streptomyces telluris]|uniref:Uncharacterized protein n=1 Tax=Streptomyces telluris TaxID=2720021 RepID=A0A9X2LEV0_9ACTN|nr:hypothetical protein [Streptomyces telluris]MCQ8769926.1 hypothetical protein [Streptomyces telluris]